MPNNLPYISPDLISEYRREIDNSVSPATGKRKISSLNKFFDWATQEGHLENNPLSEVKPPKKKIKAGYFWAIGGTLVMTVLIFLLAKQVKFPIPFRLAPASEEGAQITPGTEENKAIVASSSPWTIYAELGLKDQSNQPITTSQNITFKLYSVETGGQEVWSSKTIEVKPDSEGKADVSLSGVPSDIFFANNFLYLSPVIASSEATARIPVSTANTASNLQGYYPQVEATANSVPIIDSTGALLLASQAPAVKAINGNLLIEGQAVTLSTPQASDGDINLNPDGAGNLNLLFEGASGNQIEAKDANLSSGSLYSGIVANSSTGYDLINLQSGSTPQTRFKVDALGNTYIAGSLDFGGGIKTGGIERLSSTGALKNISGYTQTSGNFSVSKTGATAATDSATMTLDETGKTQSAYDTLVLNRVNGGPSAFALNVAIGNANFGGNVHIDGSLDINGQLQLGRFSGTPTAMGQGAMIYNTSDNKVYVWNGTAWQEVGSQLWQLLAGVLSPADATNDLAIGGTDATSPFFVDAGTGDVTSTGDVAVNGGNITSTGALALASATTNIISLDSGTTGAVNIGNGVNDKTVTIGNASTNTNIILTKGSLGNITLTGFDCTTTYTNGGTLTTDTSGHIICADDNGGGGGVIWSDLTDPDDDLTLDHLAHTTTMNWTATGALSPWTMNLTNNAGSPTSQNFVNIVNATSSQTTDVNTEALLRLDNADTSAAGSTIVDNAILVTNSGAITGGVIDAVDASASEIVNALNSGTNFLLLDGLRAFEGTTGTLTLEDTSGNDMLQVVDQGTSGRLAISDSLQVGGLTPLAYSRLGTDTTGHTGQLTTSNDLLVSGDLELNGILFLDYKQIANETGTGAILLCTQISSDCSNTTIMENALDSGSWHVDNSFNVGKAALLVDQLQGGDIFTASSSATPKFTIHNDGSITLAGMASTTNTAEATVYYDTDIDHLYLRTGDAAFHRLAMDMTKYSTNNASVANGSYLEIAHNQGVNDLAATGWIYDGSKYVEISSLTQTVLNSQDPQLVAWYKMEEASGALDNAEGTAGNDLTASGSATYQQTGKVNYALSLDGVDDRFVTQFGADNDNFDFGLGSFSIGGWFKHDAIATNPDYAITKYSATASLNVGNGADGAVVISSNTNINTTAKIIDRTTNCTDGAQQGDAVNYQVTALSSNTATLSTTVSTGCLVAGDEVLLINLRGTNGGVSNVGNWETLRVQNVSSSTVTFTTNKVKYYGSGVSDDISIGTGATDQHVMLQRVPNYTNVTVNSSYSFYPSTFDGLKGGVIFFRANGTVTVSGTITASAMGHPGALASDAAEGGDGGSSFCGVGGTGGTVGSVNGVAGAGGGGGYSLSGNGGNGNCGGGGGGVSGGTGSASYGGAGGGGGYWGSGGGGGYGTYGYGGAASGANGGTDTSGNGSSGGVPGGGGGGTYGDANLTDLHFGSGGGAGGTANHYGIAGGAGGGIVYIAGTTVTVAAASSVQANGASPGNVSCSTNYAGGSGGGAGGSVFIMGDAVSLNTTLVTVTAGSGGYGCNVGASYGLGGNGGAGRIAVQYVSSISGSTSPTYTGSQVTASSGGYKLYMNADGTVSFGIDDDITSFPEDVASSTTEYDDNVWHHFVAVKNGITSIKLYIDGQEVGSDYSLATANSISNSNPFFLGADYDGTSNTWAGLMDQIFVYGRALSPGEIQQLYQSNNSFAIEQPDTNTVRLYNYSGEAQNLRLDTVVFGADLAEYYTVDDSSIGPGDLVATTGRMDTYGVPILRKTQGINDKNLIGAISTKAGQTLGIESTDRRLLALVGRIPVKVSMASAPIKAGDFLTSSTEDGKAKRATVGQRSIGKALEDWDPAYGKEKILIMVENDVALPDFELAKNYVIRKIDELAATTYQVVTDTGEVLDNVGVFAKMVAGNIEAGFIKTKDLIADKILSPKIQTRLISPLPDQKDIVIKIGNDKTATDSSGFGKLIVENASGSAVASIDEGGNATFSGELNAKKIYADEIIAGKATFNDLFNASSSGITREEVEALLKEAEAGQRELADSLKGSIFTTTDSANLNDITTSSLFVTDIAAVKSLSITSSLTIGPDFVIEPSSINTLTAPLQLQSLALAPVELMAGRVKIDTTGNVSISGNLYVAGIVESSGITVKNENGLAVITLDASGSATFGSVSTDQIVIASDEQITPEVVDNGVITSNSTAGKAVLPAGLKEITIKNKNITDYSLVYITPTSDTTNTVLYIKSKTEGAFTVGFSDPLPFDVSFDWWVIKIE